MTIDYQNLKLLGNRLLVHRDPKEEFYGNTKLYVPEKYKEIPCVGTVVHVGPDVESCQEGDRVLFGLFAGITIGEEFGEWIIMREEEVMGILPSGEKS